MRMLPLLFVVGGITAAPVFRNTGPQVRYAGSKACAGCHPAIYRAYSRTPMGRSVTIPDPGLLDTNVLVHNAKLGRDYRVFRQGGALFQSESQSVDGRTVFETSHKLEFAIGSGENGISFAVRRGDHLFQAPLSYYSAAKRWDLSPGFEETGEGFNRPLYETCIVCHAGRPQAVPKREGLYKDPPFAEMAVSCENCHGPGQLHIAERTRGRARPPDTSIVNPRRLPARLAEDICMMCHQGGQARVLLPGKDYGDFRPGTPLIDTVAIFGLPSAGTNADLLEHHSSMKLSRCFRASNGKLGCLSCHNTHEKPDRREAAAYFRGKCLTCHTERSCSVDLASRRKTLPADNCISCHMPKRSVTRIAHSELTDHRIPVRPGANADDSQTPAADLGGVLLLNAGTANVRLPLVTRLAAFGELMTRVPALQPRYFELLNEAARSAPEDPLVLAALGRKALAGSDPEAVALLAKAEAKGATGSITYLDLGQALAQAGRLDEAVATLEKGERLFPFSQTLRKYLVLDYIRQKAYEKAKAGLERYVHDFPEDEFMRGLLNRAQRVNQP
jgi:hypothetical protein